MSYRAALPQLDDEVFLTDGGMETTLIHHEGLELPHFAAFTLLGDERGEEALRRYYASYLAVADASGRGIVLDTATWRASADWGELLGRSPEDLAAVNRRAVELLLELRAERPAGAPPVVANGVVGPRGDGYRPSEAMSAADADRYHEPQVAALAVSGADLVTALTMTAAGEAAGVVRAARRHAVPVAVSFTVETDGRLPSGQPLADAIEQVDAETDGSPVYYMVNCAHPSHFADVLDERRPPLDRIRGVRPNASSKSHAELDESDELDDGDPAALAAETAALRRRRPITILGGCCGTDERHIAAMAQAASG